MDDAKKRLEIEFHCLEARFSHLRIHKDSTLAQVMASIDKYGQLTPVVVVPEEAQRWVLIDGYLRLKALQRLGKDTVQAEVWDCKQTEGLLLILAGEQKRRWEPIEEAMLLHELQIQFGFSQRAIAKRIGRDSSWVSRRLMLIADLPETVLRAVTNGTLSIWAATRIFTPLARANAQHAEQLLQHLSKGSRSTRELKAFFHHYECANHQARKNMINDPDLFFKSLKMMKDEKKAQALAKGPEGEWLRNLSIVNESLNGLHKKLSFLFYPHQTPEEKERLTEPFSCVKNQISMLDEVIKKSSDVVHSR